MSSAAAVDYAKIDRTAQGRLMVGDSRFPSLSSIRAFEAAARLGSFSKAARELGTTSASVSYHVRQLEQQIGVPLFRRHPQRVELTEAGELVAAEAVNAFASLRASFIKAADLDQSRFSLTTLPTLGTSWLTPKLGRFRKRHPDIHLDLDLSADAQDLSTGRFDAAIRNGHGRWPGLRAVSLFPSIFMPLCVPALKRAVAGLANPRRALDVPLLGRPDWWALWYRALGVDEALPPDRFGTNLSAEYLDITAALAGHGVAIGSPILFASEIESGRLVPAHDLVASDGRSFWFTFPTVRQHSRKIVRFNEWLGEEAARARTGAAEFISGAVLAGAPRKVKGTPVRT
jgi:LysR family glycine cleavage system transcriptional activator